MDALETEVDFEKNVSTSSGDDDSTGCSNDEDTFLPNTTEQETFQPDTILPYSNEPTHSGTQPDYEYNFTDESESEDETEVEEVECLENSRIGNFEWCMCGHCRSMDTSTESLCCKEVGEISSDRFEGKQCVTLVQEFSEVCLNEVVLKVTLVGYNDMKNNNKSGKFTNRNLRFVSYKMFTWWVHNKLGKGIRRCIPSCVVWAIRDRFWKLLFDGVSSDLLREF